MFNDKRPPKYLIAKNYEEALAKINTLHLEKNHLNIVLSSGTANHRIRRIQASV